MKREVTVCDVCEYVGRTVTAYRIETSSRSVTVDLCDEHAAPLEALLPRPSAPRKAAVKKASAPVKRTRRGGTPVMTLAEIEARKKAKA